MGLEKASLEPDLCLVLYTKKTQNKSYLSDYRGGKFKLLEIKIPNLWAERMNVISVNIKQNWSIVYHTYLRLCRTNLSFGIYSYLYLYLVKGEYSNIFGYWNICIQNEYQKFYFSNIFVFVLGQQNQYSPYSSLLGQLTFVFNQFLNIFS